MNRRSQSLAELLKNGAGQAKPPVLAVGCLDDSGPAQLAVQGKGIRFRVMQVAGYRVGSFWRFLPNQTTYKDAGFEIYRFTGNCE